MQKKPTEKDSLLPSKDINKNQSTPYVDTSNEKEESVKDDNGSTLIVAFLLMLVFQLGNRIFGRLETYPMHNYPLFINMVSTFIYVPICFMYIVPMITWGDKITKEQRDIPKYQFAIMGMWDSVAGIMQTFAVNYITNASTIVLVQQSAIPISMLISKISLQAKYTTYQYIGACVVLLGIVVVLIPTLLAPAAAASSVSASSQLMWILILVLSCVPMCLSSVYKEKALGEMEIDVVYLNGWVAVFQFLISIPLCVPSASVINIPLDGIMDNMKGGMLCWMGYNSLPSDNCAAGPLYVTLYLFFNIIYNILIVVILKHGSANIMWMASTVIVPLSNVAFSLNFMPGHVPLKSWDIYGLLVIMMGLVVYRFTPSLLELYKNISGKEDTAEEIAAAKQAKMVGAKAEGMQTKFVGLNQIEGIQSMFDSRIMKEQKKALFRSPQQIRGSLLLRLGIPPSPQITINQGKNRRGVVGSPSISLVPKKTTSSPLPPIKSIPPRKTKNNEV